MPDIRLKRIYDEPEPEDGLRILATRYWPRGIPREKADWYEPKAAPSRELLHDFKHEGLPWEGYIRRYKNEMSSDAARDALDLLAEAACKGPITLMCICEEPEYCHRSILRELVLERISAPPTATS